MGESQFQIITLEENVEQKKEHNIPNAVQQTTDALQVASERPSMEQCHIPVGRQSVMGNTKPGGIL